MSALAPLCVLVLLTLAGECKSSENVFNIHAARSHGVVELPVGCLYEGRWHGPGAAVRTRAACLLCACAGGTLSCRRRSCPPLPAPPPRCHTLHRRDDCCPHIHCPDGVEYLTPEHTSTEEIITELQHSALALPACVEGGTVYAAGSAMSSDTACEQCFCLGGARRCVRPQCLPPPSGCRARPASGACCPQSYYCDHSTTMATEHRNSKDCETPDGLWVEEGKAVVSSQSACTQCFCLRGQIQCQHLYCAPNLQGCTPLVQPGQCCPHQYMCNHTKQDALNRGFERLENYLESAKTEDRSFHSSKSTKRETIITDFSSAMDNVSTITINKLPTTTSNFKSTSEETPSTIIGTESIQTEEDLLKDITTVTELSITEESTDSSTTEQPDSSVKIIINGTINCTSELSSTSFYNITSVNDTLKKHIQAQPRIPFTDGTEIEAQTFPADELITERNRNEELIDGEIFVINVTSSLRTNVTFASPATVSVTSTTILPKTVSTIPTDTHNISKKTKEDADFDYGGPTLPPSLPNLKIIPFLAADAVVDEELAPKETSYPVLEREDKFPVYYPSIDENRYSNRRKDLYNPAQHPTFTNKDKDEYHLSHRIPEIYPNKIKEVETPMEFTIGASFNNAKEITSEHKIPIILDNINLEKPAGNLFSPPIETEGGFIPKGPGIDDDYYRVYSSTPPGPVTPHITNSLQLNIKGTCVTNEGMRVEEGESVSQACSICRCAWSELHCSPRSCTVPLGCYRRPVETDLCCGEVVCENGNLTRPEDKTELYNYTHVNSQNIKDDIMNSFVNPVDISITTSNTEESNNADESDPMSERNKTQLLTTPTLNTSTLKQIISTRPTTPSEIPQGQINDTNTSSEEYDDDESDTSFSLGNVLQLLLSETYETTSTAPFKKMPPIAYTPNRPITRPHSTSALTPITTTTTSTSQPSYFRPINHNSFTPSKKLDTVNRIDHLVLGEATAIRKTTSRPIATKSVITTRKTFMKPTPRPITTKTIEITSKGQAGQALETRPMTMMPGLISGLPKVAGCNIYGRMYRVGRIITELSTPCQECKCTELGVQCRQLTC